MEKINKLIKIINIICVICVILVFCDLVIALFIGGYKDDLLKQSIESAKVIDTFLFICPTLILSVINFLNLKNDIKKDKISVSTAIINIIIYFIIMSISIITSSYIKYYISITVLSLLGIILQIIRLILIIQNNRKLN